MKARPTFVPEVALDVLPPGSHPQVAVVLARLKPFHGDAQIGTKDSVGPHPERFQLPELVDLDPVDTAEVAICRQHAGAWSDILLTGGDAFTFCHRDEW